jgi:cell division protein FtsZ
MDNQHESASEGKELGDEKVQEDSKISIVGVGDLGISISGGIYEKKIPGIEAIAISDDVKHLLTVKADRKYYLDNGIRRGLGVCTNPIIGREAALRDSEKIAELIKGKDLIFLITGLGGRIGTGAIPVIAEIAKMLGSFLIAIVTVPFGMEGRVRTDNAREALKKLSILSNTNIVIPLEALSDAFRELNDKDTWEIYEENIYEKILVEIIAMIIEPVSRMWREDKDRKDLKSILSEGGFTAIGIGGSESAGMEGLKEAAEEAVSSPLLVFDKSKSDESYVAVKNKLVKIHVPRATLKNNGAMISLSSGEDINNNEVAEALRIIKDRIGENTKTTLHSLSNPTMKGEKKCLILLTGQHFPLEPEEKPLEASESDGPVEAL